MRKWILPLLVSLFFQSCGVIPGTVAIQPSSTREPTAPSSYSPSQTSTPGALPAASPLAMVTLEPTPGPNPPLAKGQSIALSTIRMLDPHNGWGIESTGHIVRTADGGRTWRDVTPSGSPFDDSTFFALDENTALAMEKVQTPCGAASSASTVLCLGVIPWRTSDGGGTWQHAVPFISDGADLTPVSLQLASPVTGWFLYTAGHDSGGGIRMGFALTDDGGVSWIRGAIPQQPVCFASNMLFLDEKMGWIGSNCPRITSLEPPQDFLKGWFPPDLDETNDGGLSWVGKRVPLPKEYPSFVIDLKADTHSFIFCGITGLTRISAEAFTFKWECSLERVSDSVPFLFSYIYLTPDRGQTWHAWLATGNESFVDALTGWRTVSRDEGRSNQLQQTMDNGLTWTTIKNVTWSQARFDFVSAQVGWAIVTDGDNAFVLIHTIDGGRTWSEIKPSSP